MYSYSDFLFEKIISNIVTCDFILFGLNPQSASKSLDYLQTSFNRIDWLSESLARRESSL